VNTFHFGVTPEQNADAAQTCVTAVGDFAQTIAAHTASGVRLAVQPEVEVVDESNGQVGDIIGTTAPAAVSGPTSGNYAGPSGAVINWLTADVWNGRRVRGRTFIVPLAATAYDAQGTLQSTTITALTGAANTLRAREDVQLSIFRRPIRGKTSGLSDETVVISPGGQYRVTSAAVPDKVAILRSRRD